MTPTLLLTIPLLLILLGSGAAFYFGRWAENGRLTMPHLAGGLTLAPFAAFVMLLTAVPTLLDGETIAWQFDWLPAVGLTAGLYLDALGGLFALLVTGIGTLIMLYAGQYFQKDTGAGRFLTYLLLFMFAMLGIVMAGDVITLFIFWEMTSITSFLLVAYKYKYESARQGAFKAFFITGVGGIGLLVGLLLMGYVVGSFDIATILSSGDLLRDSGLYGVILAFVALGAFTKSAQFPFHIWLPNAMSAPTPASAYLHSATMVKAGIYLLARLNPVLGYTDTWFWLLTIFGGLTMLTGAYLGLKQNDLKALLAYSTISQLGVLVMMIGQDMEIAFKALVIGIVAHALYKSALFMLAGIIDHETGTRDITRLGGLRVVMPITFGLTTVAALSMAGLPPLFGFLAKETLLATAVHPSISGWVSIVLPAASVIAGALLLAQSGVLIYETFLGSPKDTTVKGHEAPRWMLLAPAVPALLSLGLGILPEPPSVATFFAEAAADAYGLGKVKVSLALWTGLNVPLLLSVVAITVGSLLFWQRHLVRQWQNAWGRDLFNRGFAATITGYDRAAWLATRLQNGKLRNYLAIILLGMLGLLLYFRGLPWPSTDMTLTPFLVDFSGELVLLRLVALIMIVGAAVATVLMKRDLAAIIALGASGMGMAVLLVLEPAPDVALVQIVVDILAVVILVLALTRLPRAQRRQVQEFSLAQSRFQLLRDGLIALGAGVAMTLLTLEALTSRTSDLANASRLSDVTPFFEANAKVLTNAKDIVGAIIVDFRALDTLIEIVVFAMAGLGIYTLLRYGARTAGDKTAVPEPLPTAVGREPLGIGGPKASAFIQVLAYLAMPLSLLLGGIHMMYGHDQPGDGFTAGVIISLAVGFWYVVFGYEKTRQRLRWLRASRLIAGGILLTIVTGTATSLLTGYFLGNYDFGKQIGLPLPDGFYLSSSFLFEVAICLTVLGSVAHMLNTLGHPGDKPSE